VKSGFISRNNPDESAKNFFLANQEAGIPRSRAVIWNIVPWYVGSGAKVRPVTKGDIREALPYLLELLALLPNLRAAVLVGQKALAGRESVEQWQPKIKVFGSPHPSPMFVNRKPGNRVRLLAGLSEVARYIHGSGSDTSTRAAGGLQKA
jgi:uracil-DNA glycosylase